MKKLLLLLLVTFHTIAGLAAIPEPLPAKKAFVFTPYIDAQDNVVLMWNIAPGYYLYQNKLKLLDDHQKNIKFTYPPATIQKDFMGKEHLVYAGILKVQVPLIGSVNNNYLIQVHYQGCSINGFCYTPIKKLINVIQTPLGKKITEGNLSPINFLSPQAQVEKLFDHHNLFYLLLSFLGLGLLLAFTPCVLPIIPILSSIIVGQKKPISTLHSFALSLSYVFGMAITYALAGVIVALAGHSLQIYFEKTWVILLFSFLFIVLSLSLFGLFDIRLPGKVQHEITELSMRQKGGTYVGVFFMGILSTLILSPCVSPPLVGVLAYIAQSGNLVLGASALFALGIGMGLPLLAIGASAGKLLPKSGPWMDWLRKMLSLAMMGVASFMLARVVPDNISILIWAGLLILFSFYSIFFYCREMIQRLFFQAAGLLIGIYGVLLILNITAGQLNLIQPWQGTSALFVKKQTQESLPFVTIAHYENLQNHFAEAQQQKQFIMMDFYAHWCSECNVIDKTIFTRKDVYNALKGFKLLRIDVTDNSSFDQKLMEQYKVYAPPAILFFDEKGRELSALRIVGQTNSQALLKNIQIIEERIRAKSI